jgi:large subunit ribosomal protein L24
MDIKIKQGDRVEVITGREEDKGKRAEVIRVLPGEKRLIVQGINVHVKHQRQMQVQGRTLAPGRVRSEGPIAISKVMLVCPKCDQRTRVGIQRTEGKANRVCKKCGAVIDS